MQVEPCWIRCDTCGLKAECICRGCLAGDEPAAVGKRVPKEYQRIVPCAGLCSEEENGIMLERLFSFSL